MANVSEAAKVERKENLEKIQETERDVATPKNQWVVNQRRAKNTSF